MIQRLLLLISSVALFSGCTSMGLDPIGKVSPAEKVALISAIDPVMQGQKLGFTIFELKNWTAENPGFDVNAIVLSAIKANLNRDVKLVNGKDVGLILTNKQNVYPLTDSQPAGLLQKLAGFGREWPVDLIILLQTTQSKDWIFGTNQPVEGFGHYARLSFGRNVVYGAFQIRIFDCKTGQFISGDLVRQARLLPDVPWHDSWNDYTPEEQRVFTRELEAMIKQSMLIFLSKAGLTDAKVDESSAGFFLFQNPAGPQQFSVPEGNELDIPNGVSRKAAHQAVANGLKDREWVLTTDTVDRMVGVYRDGKKEAMCTFTFTDHSIIMAPEGHEIQDDGQRVTVEYYHRWHKNLKESIVEELMKTPADTVAP
jgi:hypothetical protein